MAKFLTTKMIASGIESILRRSEEYVFIVSPYLAISEEFYSRLKDAVDRGVTINLVYGKSKLSDKEDEKLKVLSELNIYYYENLHAKCYLNEKNAIIGSMNFYEYSEKHNREMGIYIDATKDSTVFKEIREELSSIISGSTIKKDGANSDILVRNIISKIDTKDYFLTTDHSRVEDFYLPSVNNIITKYFDCVHSNMVLGSEDHDNWVINLVLPEELFKSIEVNIDNRITIWFNDEKMTHFKSLFVNHLETKLSNLRPRIYDNYFGVTVYRPQFMSYEIDDQNLKEVTNFFVKTLLILLYELEIYVSNCENDAVDIESIYS